MNLKICFFIGAIVFLTQVYIHVNAQTDFHAGYVIKLNSDTLFGQIDARGAIRNSESCSFRNSEKDGIIEFHPGEIKAYRFIDGKYYVSMTIPDSMKGNVVFLEFLLHGLTDLFYYKTSERERYYMQKSGGLLLELTNDEIVHSLTRNSNGTNAISTENEQAIGKVDGEYKRNSLKYIGILKATFADCNKLGNEINHTEFTPGSLIKITRKYHEYMCDSFQCVVYEKKIGPKFKFAPVFRSDFSSLSFNTSNGLFIPEIYTHLNHPMTLNYGIGVNMDVSSTRANDKFSIQFETYFSRNYYKYEGTETGTFVYSVQSTVIMSNIASENFLSLKYTYPRGIIRPTAFIGGGAAVAISTQNKRISENIGGSYTTPPANFYDVPLPNVFVGFSGRAGINYVLSSKKIAFVQIKFENLYSENFSYIPNSTIYAISLNIGIYL